jgi:hypothetical protein
MDKTYDGVDKTRKPAQSMLPEQKKPETGRFQAKKRIRGPNSRFHMTKDGPVRL